MPDVLRDVERRAERCSEVVVVPRVCDALSGRHASPRPSARGRPPPSLSGPMTGKQITFPGEKPQNRPLRARFPLLFSHTKNINSAAWTVHESRGWGEPHRPGVLPGHRTSPATRFRDQMYHALPVVNRTSDTKILWFGVFHIRGTFLALIKLPCYSIFAYRLASCHWEMQF